MVNSQVILYKHYYTVDDNHYHLESQDF